VDDLYVDESEAREGQAPKAAIYMAGDDSPVLSVEAPDLLVDRLMAADPDLFLVVELPDGRSGYLKPRAVTAVLPPYFIEDDEE
jgi:hypothetical protein